MDGQPNVPDFKGGLARAHSNLAGRAFTDRRCHGAIEASRQATEFYECWPRPTRHIQYQGGLAQCLSRAGIWLRFRAGDKAARSGRAVGRSNCTGLVDGQAEYPRIPAGTRLRAANCHGRFAAKQATSKALSGVTPGGRRKLETLLTAQPNVPIYQETLAMSLTKLGILLSKTGDSHGAIAEFDRAINRVRNW